MQFRMPFAVVLLSCAALAQETPGDLRPIPKPFDSKPRRFSFPKPFSSAKPAVKSPQQAPNAQPDVCAIPLKTVPANGFASKMPIIPSDGKGYSMAFVTPPAPVCDDSRSAKKQAPSESKP